MKKTYETPVMDLVVIKGDVICASDPSCANGTPVVSCPVDI